MRAVNKIGILKNNAKEWHKSCVHTECTFHQLSPYIGKLKSSIAAELVRTYSQSGDLIVDPFSGSGTIPLEAIIQGRNVFAADISEYAHVLTDGKLTAPSSVEVALKQAEELIKKSKRRKSIDLRKIPKWIRNFFHPETLREIVAFADTCKKYNNNFIFSCFLGILHHQRPGFLSYPSSHLVPYLRDKTYPEKKFPELYRYRDIAPRLFSKIQRAYKRTPDISKKIKSTFKKGPVDDIVLPRKFDCLITSPPYMNTLDYVRDNRLRLWFSDNEFMKNLNDCSINSKSSFIKGIGSLAENTNKRLSINGYAILVIGDKTSGRRDAERHPSRMVMEVFKELAPNLELSDSISDNIPDIRRSRRECRGIKKEEILVYRRVK